MRLAPLAAIVAALLLPATASAGVVVTSSGSDPTSNSGDVVVQYSGLPGEANTVNAHFQLHGHWIDIYDKTAPMSTNDPNCSVVYAWQVHCVMPPNVSDLTQNVTLRVDLGDGNDSFEPSAGTAPYRAIVYGGPGIDDITLPRNSQPFPSLAYGEDGNDIFHSAAQAGDTWNYFAGGAGDDYFLTVNGAPDTIDCNDGIDYVRADGGDQVGDTCETVQRN